MCYTTLSAIIHQPNYPTGANASLGWPAAVFWMLTRDSAAPDGATPRDRQILMTSVCQSWWITKSKSTHQAHNPTVLLDMFSTSSQCNSNSLHHSGSKVYYWKFWENSWSLLPSNSHNCPLSTTVPAGPWYCYQ